MAPKDVHGVEPQFLDFIQECFSRSLLVVRLGVGWKARQLALGQRSLQLNVAAAAAAKSRQSCPTLCDPIDGSPPGSPVPGILQARILEWVAISFSNA